MELHNQIEEDPFAMHQQDSWVTHQSNGNQPVQALVRVKIKVQKCVKWCRDASKLKFRLCNISKWCYLWHQYGILVLCFFVKVEKIRTMVLLRSPQNFNNKKLQDEGYWTLKYNKTVDCTAGLELPRQKNK